MYAAAISFPDIGAELFRIEIGGFVLAIRYYALAYIAGLLIGWWLILRAIRRPELWPDNTAAMTPEQVESLLTWIVIGVIVGGRLGFVTFYQPAHYLANPLDIVKVWQGGMSFHGGFLGVLVVVIVFARRHGLALGAVADLMALATPPGLLLGRIANFINAELWGRQSDMPWAVIFPGAAAQDCPTIVGLCARHPSQLYEAGLEGLILGGLLLWLALRGQAFGRRWLLTGTFLAGYGASRFVVEYFRQADTQFISPDNPAGHILRLGEAGLAMGQLLSLPMLLIGVALMVWATRRAQ